MKGHPIRGFFAGVLLGICLVLDLALGGVVETNSGVLTVVFVVSVVVCFLLGLWAPIGRSRKQKTSARVASPLPTPRAWPESAPTEGSSTPTPQAWNTPLPPPANGQPGPTGGDQLPPPPSPPPPAPI